MKLPIIQDLLEHLTIPDTRVIIVVRDSHYANYIVSRLGLKKIDWRNKDGTICVRLVRAQQDLWSMSGLQCTRVYMVDNSSPYVDTTHLQVENFLKSRMRSPTYRGLFELIRFQMSYKD